MYSPNKMVFVPDTQNNDKKQNKNKMTSYLASKLDDLAHFLNSNANYILGVSLSGTVLGLSFCKIHSPLKNMTYSRVG